MPRPSEHVEEKRYTNGNFPCLVRYGAALEKLPADPSNIEEYYRVHSRNVLRNLTYGTPLFEGQLLSLPNLKLVWLFFKTLVIKRNERLLTVLREEMKFIFSQAFQISEDCDSATEEQLEIFINTLLSSFPFMNPEEGETVAVPQKINKQWLLIHYEFKKIDLSPKKGLWSKLIEEEDRLYAYALEPRSDCASPFLLLMGTTYLSGQGASLSWLGDLTAGQSIGERHDLTDLEQWILPRRNIIISGHSQGATMAKIVAAKYPDHVLLVFGLNPTALHQATLLRLLPLWQKARERNPEIRRLSSKTDSFYLDNPTQHFTLDNGIAQI